MARRKTATDIESIAAERQRLEEQLREVQQREKAALEAQRDAGRAPLMLALERVRIAPMDKVQAKAIAQAIARLGTVEVVRRLSAD